MKRSFKKLGAKDFKRRVRRVDPAFALFGSAANRKDTTYRRPGLSWLFGVGWLYLLATVATDLNAVPERIAQTALPENLHFWAMGGVIAFLSCSVIFLAAQALRAIASRGARRVNARALVFGAICGLALFATPATWIEEARTIAFDLIAASKDAAQS